MVSHSYNPAMLTSVTLPTTSFDSKKQLCQARQVPEASKTLRSKLRYCQAELTAIL